MSSSVPPFSLTKPRYDLRTFVGRAKHFYQATNPFTLLASEQEIHDACALLDHYKNNTLPEGVTDAQLWDALNLKHSAVHPDTEEIIPRPFRFAAFPVANVLIVPVMLLPSTIASVPRTIAIHWLNQSFNAAVNYANRNASHPTPTSVLLQGYAGAVTTSISIGLSATFLSRRFHGSLLVRALLPLLASVGAGCANLCLMRRTELTEGVQLIDGEGGKHGKSVAAGQTGVLKCCAARLIWNLPILTLPPVAMSFILRRSSFLRSSPSFCRVMEVALITIFLFAGVPPALGFFPQRDTISVDKVEPHFHGLTDSHGQPITEFFYNKGL